MWDRIAYSMLCALSYNLLHFMARSLAMNNYRMVPYAQYL